MSNEKYASNIASAKEIENLCRRFSGHWSRPPINGSSQVPKGLNMTPTTHQGGPGGQQDQGHGLVLHVHGEGYQPPITSRTGSSRVCQGLSMYPLPVKVDQVDCEIKNMG